MTDPRFPGAPEGSYVSEEGWLVVGDEAWTEHEWKYPLGERPRQIGRGKPRIYSDEEYLAVRRVRERERRARMTQEQRAARNEYNRRWRAQRKAA